MLSAQTGKYLQLALAALALVGLVMGAYTYWQIRSADVYSDDYRIGMKRIMWVWAPVFAGSLALSVGLDLYDSKTMPMAPRLLM